MSKDAGQDPTEADDIGQLRAVLARYDQHLSGISHRTAKHRGSAGSSAEPLMLLNGIPVDLRSSSLEAYRTIEAPEIVDCCKSEDPDPFTFVQQVKSGNFRVHPRRGKLSAGLIGPFSGPAPDGVLAVAQTTHESAPPVRFHASLWTGDCEAGAIGARLGDTGRHLPFVSVEPGRQGFLVSMPAATASRPSDVEGSPWGVLLATMAEPAEAIDYAWADYVTIALLFSSDDGADVALLI